MLLVSGCDNWGSPLLECSGAKSMEQPETNPRGRSDSESSRCFPRNRTSPTMSSISNVAVCGSLGSHMFPHIQVFRLGDLCFAVSFSALCTFLLCGKRQPCARRR
ncbi:hypothetical protein SKAU_G00016050 [Synaphobranchus kaupii]|uniref:Uncharacterized protein n=1 Tax=Synaphobranchus kaupii TaxID=118154 RepID=A0A9Q1GB83_SYNKA|nr:hypothetical protein SKAU_G00016050 [Synaphobranchus kaupii]